MDKTLHKKLFTYFVYSFQEKEKIIFKKYESFTSFYVYYYSPEYQKMQHELTEIIYYADHTENEKELEIVELYVFWKHQGKGSYFFPTTDVKKLNRKVTKALKGGKAARYRQMETEMRLLYADDYGDIQEIWFGNNRKRLEKESKFLSALIECFVLDEREVQEYKWDRLSLHKIWRNFGTSEYPYNYPSICYMYLGSDYDQKTGVKENDLDV